MIMFSSIFIYFRERKFIQESFLALMYSFKAYTFFFQRFRGRSRPTILAMISPCSSTSSANLYKSSYSGYLSSSMFSILRQWLKVLFELPSHFYKIIFGIEMWDGFNIIIDKVLEKLLVHVLKLGSFTKHDHRVSLISFWFNSHIIFMRRGITWTGSVSSLFLRVVTSSNNICRFQVLSKLTSIYCTCCFWLHWCNSIINII